MDAPAPPGRRKNRRNLQGKFLSAPQHVKCTPRESGAILGHFCLAGRFGGSFSTFRRSLRATTKKVVNFLRKKCTPDKILATPMFEDIVDIAKGNPEVIKDAVTK